MITVGQCNFGNFIDCLLQLLRHCWSWIIQVQDKHVFYMQHKVMEHFASIYQLFRLWLLYVLLWFSCGIIQYS